MAKKRIVLVGIVALIVLIVMGVIYYAPKQISASVTVWSREGEAKEAVFDVKYHKRIFSKPKLTGKIILDDIEYVAYQDAYSKLKTKQMLFVVPTTSPIDVTEYIRVQIVNPKMDCLWLHIVGEQGQCSYFGPAQTAEEAKEIIEKIDSGLL